jgi:hypothetical protein
MTSGNSGLLGALVGDDVSERTAAVGVPEHHQRRRQRSVGVLGLAQPVGRRRPGQAVEWAACYLNSPSGPSLRLRGARQPIREGGREPGGRLLSAANASLNASASASTSGSLKIVS